MGAGKGWCNEENVLACKSYLAHSRDPNKGCGKKPEVFHKEVEETYSRLREELIAQEPVLRASLHPRTGRAIAQRYKNRIRVECLAIESCVARIKREKPTGNPSEEDILRFAVAMHTGTHMSKMYDYLRNPERVSLKPCRFLSCLRYLRSNPIWEKTRAAVTRSILNGTPVDTGDAKPDDSSDGATNCAQYPISAAVIAPAVTQQGSPAPAARPAVLVPSVQRIAPAPTVTAAAADVPQEGVGTGVVSTGHAGVGSGHTVNRVNGYVPNGLPPSAPAPDSTSARLLTGLASAAEPAVGSKRAFNFADHTGALQRGTAAIEELTKEVAKRNKISLEFLAVEKQKNRIQLFSMPGTSPGIRDRFLQLSQEAELREMEECVRGDSHSPSAAVRIAPLNHARDAP